MRNKFTFADACSYKQLARVLGFEPRMVDPKSTALPLGHTRKMVMWNTQSPVLHACIVHDANVFVNFPHSQLEEFQEQSINGKAQQIGVFPLMLCWKKKREDSNMTDIINNINNTSKVDSILLSIINEFKSDKKALTKISVTCYTIRNRGILVGYLLMLLSRTSCSWQIVRLGKRHDTEPIIRTLFPKLILKSCINLRCLQ